MRLKKPRKGFIPPHELYTIGEEIANSITHGIGAALSIAGTAVLVSLAALHGDTWQLVSVIIYGTSLVLLYMASTLYHSFQNPRTKALFQRLDHAAIYLLIAGTYTPFMLVGVRNSWALTVLAVVWGIAFLGVAFKTLFIERYQRLSALGYVLMGWLGVIAGIEQLTSLPQVALIWLAVGGASYTVGIIFAAWRRLPYSHTVWHVFVLGGSVCHYLAIVHLLPVG